MREKERAEGARGRPRTGDETGSELGSLDTLRPTLFGREREVVFDLQMEVRVDAARVLRRVSNGGNKNHVSRVLIRCACANCLIFNLTEKLLLGFDEKIDKMCKVLLNIMIMLVFLNTITIIMYCTCYVFCIKKVFINIPFFK